MCSRWVMRTMRLSPAPLAERHGCVKLWLKKAFISLEYKKLEPQKGIIQSASHLRICFWCWERMFRGWAVDFLREVFCPHRRKAATPVPGQEHFGLPCWSSYSYCWYLHRSYQLLGVCCTRATHWGSRWHSNGLVEFLKTTPSSQTRRQRISLVKHTQQDFDTVCGAMASQLAALFAFLKSSPAHQPDMEGEDLALCADPSYWLYGQLSFCLRVAMRKQQRPEVNRTSKQAKKEKRRALPQC